MVMDKRSNIKQKVGKRIAELRKEAGLTQEQLAIKTEAENKAKAIEKKYGVTK